MRILSALIFLLWTSFALADASSYGPGVVPNANGQLPSMSNGVAPSTIWIPTAAQTINTVNETSLFSPTGGGSGRTVAGAVQYVANSFHGHEVGIVTTPISGGSTTLKIKYGSVAIITQTGITLSISLTNQPWVLDFDCTFRTINNATPTQSGMVCGGSLIGATSTPAVFSSTSPTLVDTTVPASIDATWTWAAVTSQTLTVEDGRVQITF